MRGPQPVGALRRSARERMLREYTTQFIFIALHSVIIIYTVLITATNLKINGYPEEAWFADPFSLYVRHYGMTLLVVPALWLVFTIWIDNEGWEHSRKIVVVSGFGIIVILVMIGFASMIGAQPRGPLRMAE